jgi:dipeptidyl aminopeptidase/acylaminoacyl peptidase
MTGEFIETQEQDVKSKTIASYGTWTSPITAKKIAEGTTSILNLLTDGTDTYWCELRPANRGRYTIVKRDVDGKTSDITPSDFNARTFVHEYGGGAFAVRDGIVYSSNASDHKIYVMKPGQLPVPLTQGQQRIELNGTQQWQGTRFADMHVSRKGLIAIGEDHQPLREAENFLALISLETGNVIKIASGYDFYSSPAISHDEKSIAWICWNHPELPWTQTELWIGELDEQGHIIHPKQIAGDVPESIFQPQWSPDGTLYFVTDRDRGWWNLHRYRNGLIENVCPMEAEVAEPLWVFERSTYAFFGDRILFAYNQNGKWNLAILDPESKTWKKIQREGNYYQQLRSGKDCVQLLESYPNKPEALIQIDPLPGLPTRTLRINPQQIEEEGYISAPTHIQYKSNGRTAYGIYFAPKNKDFQAPEGEKPPLVVMIHGGPTSQSRPAFSLARQFWTSRGFAVFDVNYGGSTGYGREYRYALNGNWGVVDVEDCANGALYLAQQGLVDPDKLVIRGGSAGGYTTLAALAFHTIFKAGASYFGVADITALGNDTHKFEKRYFDHLIGKYPEEKALWESRSPINSIDTIHSPLILFQGEEDRIVPKNQSEMIYEALKKRGIPTEIHIYPEEEHGFRQAKNIIHSLEREAEFYQEVFGLKPADREK